MRRRVDRSPHGEPDQHEADEQHPELQGSHFEELHRGGQQHENEDFEFDEAIREALALWVNDAARAELKPVIHLPADARHEVQRALAVRERATQADLEAAAVLRETIWELTERENLSTRDVAAVLQLSPARVDQLKPGHVLQYQAASARTLSAKKAVRRRTAARVRSASKRATRR